MKKIILIALTLTVGVPTLQGQTMKEKMAAKLAAKMEKNKKPKKVKFSEPYEADFSDESGISGTYYPTTELISNDKHVKALKFDFNGKDKLLVYYSNEEYAKSVFWILDQHEYALTTYNHYEFTYKRSVKIFSIEPGVLVMGALKGSSNGLIPDEATFRPVIIVKDTAMMNKYTYEDAKTFLLEGMDKQEKYNRERSSGSTKMADVGDLTSNKELMRECWKTIEHTLSQKPDWSGELSNYQMHYIYEKQWGKDPSSKVYNGTTKTYDYTRKMILVLVVFKDPKKDELTYYSFTIVKPTEDAENNYKGFKFNSNSRKQLVSKKIVDAKKVEVAKF